MKSNPTQQANSMESKAPRTIKIEQIKQIYDYTKYHISFYFALLTASGGLARFATNITPRERSALLIITSILLVAGMAGALVASRIVYGPWGKRFFLIEQSWFWKKRWKWPTRWPKWWPLKWSKNCNYWWSIADVCLILEHYGFWLALFIALFTFVFVTPKPS